jgi:TetR/AcrR family transcriptional regulator
MRELPNGMREKLLTAAQLFADQGLDATRMEDIAATTGVPKATLYYYFKGKEDILAFLFAEILDEVGRAIGGALQTGGTAADRLRAAILAHLRVFEEYPAASRALQFDLGRAARIPLIDQRTDAAFLGPVRNVLKDGAKDGSLRAFKHPRMVAVGILGAITTIGINTLSLGATRSVEDIAEDAIDLLLRGLAT